MIQANVKGFLTRRKYWRRWITRSNNAVVII